MFHIFICRMMEHIQSYLFVILHISERFSLQTKIRVLKKYTATSAQPDIPPALLHARSSSDLVCSATLVRNWGDLQHLYYPHMRAWVKIHCPPKRRDGSKTMNFAISFGMVTILSPSPYSGNHLNGTIPCGSTTWGVTGCKEMVVANWCRCWPLTQRCWRFQ